MSKKLAVLIAAFVVLGFVIRLKEERTEDADFDRLIKQELTEKASKRSSRPVLSRATPKGNLLESKSNVGKQAASSTGSPITFVPTRSTDEDEVILDETRQSQIWDLEHFTFELEWKFGKLVKEAIKKRDRQALTERFLPQAKGSIPSGTSTTSDDDGWWKQTHIQAPNSSTRSEADADQICNYLLDATSGFTNIERMSLRILDIVEIESKTNPTSESNANQPWRRYSLKVLLTAKGPSSNGPASMSSKHRLAVQFRNDQDIVDGTIVNAWHVESLTQRQTVQPLFTERTAQYGLDRLELNDNWKCSPGEAPNTYSSQIAVEDFDRDGFLDIAISTLQGDQYLLRNVGGSSFEDVTESFGLPTVRNESLKTIATWIDYNNDQFPDLVLGDQLYHNDKAQRFIRATRLAGLRFSQPTMGAVVADYDCDGWLDLYVLNHHGSRAGKKIGFVEDDTQSGIENILWRNTGKGTFEQVTDVAGVGGEKRHSFAASWFHANEDHYPDLYVVNDFGRNCFYLNQGDGTFTDITDKAGVGDFANSMGVATGDLDNDGTAEIYVANMFSKMGRRIIAHVKPEDYPAGVYRGIEGACAGSHLYQRSNNGDAYDDISVEDHVNEVGWAYAPVFADFDADGLLDIYATSGFISTDRRKPDG